MAIRPASSLARTPYLNALIMGTSKIGKTTTVIATSPAPVLVIHCDPGGDKDFLGLQEFVDDKRYDVLDVDLDHPYESMVNAYNEAGRLAGSHYKTIVIDTISNLINAMEVEVLDEFENKEAGKKAHGKLAYDELKRRVDVIVKRFTGLPCHIIANTHWIDYDSKPDTNQESFAGQGIVPNVPGKLRRYLPTLFCQVIFMGINGEKRFFLANPQGAWGPGSRMLKGTAELDADINAIARTIENKLAASRPGAETQTEPQPQPQPKKTGLRKVK